MDDFDFDNPAFDRDDDVDDFDDEEVDPLLVNPNDVTGIGDGSGAGTRVLSLQQELLQTAVDNYYDTLANQGLSPALGRDMTKFELVDGRLRLKAFPSIRLVNLRTGGPPRFQRCGQTAWWGKGDPGPGFPGLEPERTKVASCGGCGPQQSQPGVGRGGWAHGHSRGGGGGGGGGLQDLGQDREMRPRMPFTQWKLP